MRQIFDYAIAAVAVVFGLAIIILPLMGCAPNHRPDPAPPAVVTRDVLVPVRAACIEAKDVPPIVPPTALSGGAKHDSAALAATDNLLRTQVAALLALISPACTQ